MNTLLLIIVSIILNIGLFILCLYFLKLLKKNKQEYQFYKDKTYNEILDENKNRLNADLSTVQNQLAQVTASLKEKQEFNKTVMKMREDEINRLAKIKYDQAIEQIQQAIDAWTISAQEAANENQKDYRAKLQLQTENTEKELQQIQAYLDEYKEKQETVNKEILRRRAIEEKEDFYRIQLDDNSKSDIEILNNIRQRLNKTDLLNKLIYENYIARPSKEMIKRVLGGKNPSGIYKVTNTKTNEIYIGKSVKIADRFSNHIKSAYGLEGVAESQFQRALKKYGIDMFTWELLEECPKENLTEREKYYIVFYGTKEYGYNQREG